VTAKNNPPTSARRLITKEGPTIEAARLGGLAATKKRYQAMR